MGRIFHDKTFVRVIIAFVCGIAWGLLFPSTAPFLGVVASAFVKCIKMVVVPIIFFSLVAGICSHDDGGKSVRSLFIKTIIYFEVMSILAILITFAITLLWRPGAGIDIAAFPAMDVSAYIEKGKNLTFSDFLLNIIPDSFFAALTGDKLLSVIFLAILFSIAVLRLPNREPIVRFINQGNRIFFQIMGIIIAFSPIATFAAIGYSVAHSGLDVLASLVNLLGVVLVSMIAFCSLLALIARWVYGIPVLRLMKSIKEEMVLAFATSSSESVFPQLLVKLEKFGASKKVVNFVLPMGYSFNLDGSAIYVTAGAIFIQQAYHIPFGPSDYLTLFCILLFTSKGAAGIAGAGFITLSATLGAIPGHPIPIEGLGLLLGIDRFMSDMRTICNVTGNTIGTMIIARSEDALEMPVTQLEHST